MKTRLPMTAIALTMVAAAAFAQQHHGKQHGQFAHPYAGQQMRVIASLSDGEVQGFLEGRGMGLARSAELNGHPGPMHVLELAEELKLTAEQRQAVKAAFDRMKIKAKTLGEAYVKAEQAVDQVFKSGAADADEVADRVAEANRLLGEVRLSHLQAHVEITPLLTSEQRARYMELRGYTGNSTGGTAHQHLRKH